MARILIVSDNHNYRLPDNAFYGVDLVLHCGDATSLGTRSQYNDFFSSMYERLSKHEIKMIYVPGNHDKNEESMFDVVLPFQDRIEILIHSESIFGDELGLEIFGSRWCKEFAGWEGELKFYDRQQMWKNIPHDLDFLLTHTPPYGVMDYVDNWRKDYCGCSELRREIINKNPVVHCFGHIHSMHGYEYNPDRDNIHYFNVAYCDDEYQPSHKLTYINYDVENCKLISYEHLTSGENRQKNRRGE